MMKRLIFVVATLLLLASPAQAVYVGVLSSALTTTFTVSNPSTNTNLGSAAATICLLVPSENHAAGSEPACFPLTAAPGASPQVTLNLTGTTRVRVDVAIPNAANIHPVTLVVVQAATRATTFTLPVTADAGFVFDVQ
jgi:hypothetical protein